MPIVATKPRMGKPATKPPDLTTETARLIGLVYNTIRASITCTDDDAVIITVMILHCATCEADSKCTYMAVSALDGNSGKSTLCKILSDLIPNASWLVMPTLAALARIIRDEGPTPIIDELDSLIKSLGAAGSAQFWGWIKSGSAQGADNPLCDPDGKSTIKRDPFGPKVFAFNGPEMLEKLVASRCIFITLKTQTIEEYYARRVTRLRAENDAPHIRAEIAQWSMQAVPAIRRIIATQEIRTNEGVLLGNRDADTWQSLIAIATLAGDTWNKRLRGAMAGKLDETAESVSGHTSIFDNAVKTMLARMGKVSDYNNKKEIPPIADQSHRGMDAEALGWKHSSSGGSFSAMSLRHRPDGRIMLHMHSDGFAIFWGFVQRSDPKTELLKPRDMLRTLRDANRLDNDSSKSLATNGRVWASDSKQDRIICIDVTCWFSPDNSPVPIVARKKSALRVSNTHATILKKDDKTWD